MSRSVAVFVSLRASAILAVVVLLTLNLPVAAATYTWNGTESSDWETAANWNSGTIAPTGGTYDATLYINNKTNPGLVYSDANGTTLYTPSISPNRCLRIADNWYGSLTITGGTLETRCSANGGDFVGNGLGNSGLFVIDGGTYISTNSNSAFLLGANNGNGTLIVSNGLAQISTVSIWSTSGTLNLVGGTLSIGSMGLYSGGLFATLNLNGGTLQAWNGSTAWLYAGKNLAVRLNGAVVFDTQNNFVTNAAPIIGTGTLTKVGSGTLWLNVSNTVGAVTVNEGSLYLGGSNAITAGVTLNAGALGVNHPAALGSAPLTINGGCLDNSSGVSVENAMGNSIAINTNTLAFVGTRDLNLGAGAVSINNDMLFSNAVKKLTFGGPLSDGGGSSALTVRGSGGLALLGDLSIGGRVLAAGGSTLTLAGANTYTGATMVSASTLIAANDRALGSANAATTVADNGTLQLTNGVVIDAETVFLGGTGLDNRGALQAACNSTGTWNSAIMLNDANTWTPRLGHKPNGVLIVNGPIQSAFSSANNLFVSGDPGNGRVIINSTSNTYSGTTGIIRGTLALGADNALPVGTVLDLHPASGVSEWSMFDLAGFSQTVAGLKETTGSIGARYVTNSSETVSVLTVNQTSSTTYGGFIGGNVSLVKSGSGTLALSGTNNAYTGAMVLNAGTLALDASGALSPATSLTLAGGTLSLGSWTNSVQQLTVSGDAAIDVGDGTGRFVVADSSAQVWSGTLNLTGTFNVSTVRFGANATALTQEQLGMLRVNGQRLWFALDENGYLYERKGTFFSVL